MSTLPTVAQAESKPTREQAQRYLLELWEQNPSIQLAKLYKWFEPTVPAKPKTPEQWLLKALAGRTDYRKYLQNRYSDGNTLVATDGHRLHLCRNLDHPTGYYDKAMNAIEDSARYPDFERVIPKDASEPVRLGDITPEPMVKVIKDKPHNRVIIQGTCVDVKYWNDAISGLSDDAMVHIREPYDAIKLVDGDRVAVISPIRV